MNQKQPNRHMLEEAVINTAQAVRAAMAVAEESPSDYALRFKVTAARAAQRQAIRELEKYCLQHGLSTDQASKASFDGVLDLAPSFCA